MAGWDFADEPAPDEQSAPIRPGWDVLPQSGKIDDRRNINPMTALQLFYSVINNEPLRQSRRTRVDNLPSQPSPEMNRDIDETVKSEKLKSAMKELQFRESAPLPVDSRYGMSLPNPAAAGLYKHYGYKFENTPGQRVAPRDFDPEETELPIHANRTFPRDSPEGIQMENQMIDMYNDMYGGE
jgi:hypothetical protein